MGALTATKPKLYQYEACPFCAKVRALMRYKGIPCEIIEVHPINKKEIAFSKEYRKVPILVTEEGKQINDSTEILRYLEEQHPEKALFEKEEVAHQREEEWLKWADETLVRALPPLIYRNLPEALKAFRYITKVGKFNWFQQRMIKYAGAAIMTMVAKKGAKSREIGDPVTHFKACLKQWEKALGGLKFLGGDKPNAADLATYGYLKSVESLPAFSYVQENRTVMSWYEQVNTLCTKP